MCAQASVAAAEADERLVQVRAQVAEQDGELQRIGRENAVEREALRREVQSIRDALQVRPHSSHCLQCVLA